MKGAAGGPAYERSFRWKIGQFRHLCQVFVFFQTTELCHPSIPTQSPVLCACLRWWNWYKFLWSNHLAKKVVSGRPGLLGFAIRPVKSVLNLPSKCPASELLLLLLLLLCCFFWGGGGGRFKWQKSCIQWCWSKSIKYLHANHSFPEWQAVKLTFFAPRGWC